MAWTFCLSTIPHTAAKARRMRTRPAGHGMTTCSGASSFASPGVCLLLMGAWNNLDTITLHCLPVSRWHLLSLSALEAPLILPLSELRCATAAADLQRPVPRTASLVTTAKQCAVAGTVTCQRAQHQQLLRSASPSSAMIGEVLSLCCLIPHRPSLRCLASSHQLHVPTNVCRHTALLPVLLRDRYQPWNVYKDATSILTIHNMAHQVSRAGVGEEHLRPSRQRTLFCFLPCTRAKLSANQPGGLLLCSGRVQRQRIQRAWP